MIIVGIITDLEEKEEVERIAKLFIFGQRIRKLSHKWLYALYLHLLKRIEREEMPFSTTISDGFTH